MGSRAVMLSLSALLGAAIAAPGAWAASITRGGQPAELTLTTGGFYTTSELTGELYARWFQFSAFSGSFRSHGRIRGPRRATCTCRPARGTTGGTTRGTTVAPP